MVEVICSLNARLRKQERHDIDQSVLQYLHCRRSGYTDDRELQRDDI
jgi:hypothetical protein